MAKSKSSSNGGGAAVVSTAQVNKILAALAAVTKTIGALGLPVLTSEERRTATGRLRQGEAEAMTAVFDTMDAYPGVFASLADKDGGVDPNLVETDPSRAALSGAQALAPLHGALEVAAQAVADGILGLASQAKEVSLPAYAIGKAASSSDTALRKVLAPAISFYAKPAAERLARQQRAAKKAKSAAKAAQ